MKCTTLCYLEQNDQYLMLYRNRKKDDPNAGKWIGVGGKLETGESPDQCIVREVLEETGLILTGYDFLGVILFESDRWETECMMLYLGREFSGSLREDCEEGTLRWIAKDEILSLPLWEGDRIFLRAMLRGDRRICMKLVYQGEKLISTEETDYDGQQ